MNVFAHDVAAHVLWERAHNVRPHCNVNKNEDAYFSVNHTERIRQTLTDYDCVQCVNDMHVCIPLRKLQCIAKVRFVQIPFRRCCDSSVASTAYGRLQDGKRLNKGGRNVRPPLLLL